MASHSYRKFSPWIDEIPKPKKRGPKFKYPVDRIGSVNVRISTLQLIHRVREKMAEISAEKVPLHEALDRMVKHYLDCAGGGAAQKTPAHSRRERMP